jgi:hypothetical protein
VPEQGGNRRRYGDDPEHDRLFPVAGLNSAISPMHLK